MRHRRWLNISLLTMAALAGCAPDAMFAGGTCAAVGSAGAAEALGAGVAWGRVGFQASVVWQSPQVAAKWACAGKGCGSSFSPSFWKPCMATGTTEPLLLRLRRPLTPLCQPT